MKFHNGLLSAREAVNQFFPRWIKNSNKDFDRLDVDSETHALRHVQRRSHEILAPLFIVASQKPERFEDAGTEGVTPKRVLPAEILELIERDACGLNLAELQLALKEDHRSNELAIDETIFSAHPGLFGHDLEGVARLLRKQ